MQTTKLNYKSIHQTVTLLGLAIIIIGYQFMPKDTLLYLILPVVGVMFVSLFFKAKQERAEGTFDKKRYMMFGLAILSTIGIAIYFLLFAM